MDDVTILLKAVEAGEPGAEDRLWALVYGELRRMANQHMAGESRQITLQPTAVVHEAWLRLAPKNGGAVAWQGRAHFFAAAGEAMRRILVDQARRRLAAKRGGGQAESPLVDAVDVAVAEDTRILEVHAALETLAARDPQLAQVVKLLFFVGLSQREAADLLEVSEKTIQRQWTLAKAFLFQEIKSRNRAGPGNLADEESG
jgi:RNA polymerase sigma factor (TIGR02999 family)